MSDDIAEPQEHDHAENRQRAGRKDPAMVPNFVDAWLPFDKIRSFSLPFAHRFGGRQTIPEQPSGTLPQPHAPTWDRLPACLTELALTPRDHPIATGRPLRCRAEPSGVRRPASRPRQPLPTPAHRAAVNAAFAHEDALRGNPLPQADRVPQIRLERAQIAVIDSNERRTRLQYPLAMIGLVKFDQWRHAELDRFVKQLSQLAIVQTLGDQQDRIGAATRASKSWYVSIKKSFRSSGRPTACRTCVK